MSKKIKIKVIHLNEEYSAVQIIEQTHIGEEFGGFPDKSMPKAFIAQKTSLMFYSGGHPQNDIDEEDIFYVRGTESKKNDLPVIVSNSELNRIIETVKEYNNYYKDEEDNRKEDKEIKFYYVE